MGFSTGSRNLMTSTMPRISFGTNWITKTSGDIEYRRSGFSEWEERWAALGIVSEIGSLHETLRIQYFQGYEQFHKYSSSSPILRDSSYSSNFKLKFFYNLRIHLGFDNTFGFALYTCQYHDEFLASKYISIFSNRIHICRLNSRTIRVFKMLHGKRNI